MSTGAEPQDPAGDVSLQSGAALAGLSAYDLWTRCAGRGCHLSEAEIGRAMSGAGPLAEADRAMLAGVLDDHLRVLGCDRRVGHENSARCRSR